MDKIERPVTIRIGSLERQMYLCRTMDGASSQWKAISIQMRTEPGSSALALEILATGVGEFGRKVCTHKLLETAAEMFEAQAEQIRLEMKFFSDPVNSALSPL